MAYFIHVANVLYLFSYLVRDILWLRVLTVVAGLVLMPYFLLQQPPLLAPVAWNVLFTAINAVQIVRLLYERRPVVLTEDQARLYKLAFRTLSDREFLRLARVGSWKKSAPAERIVDQGVVLDELACVLTGKLAVKVDGKFVTHLEPGRFVGEMSYLTGAATTASVEALETTTCLSWTRASLSKLLEADPSLRAAVQHVIGRDLVAKLRTGHGADAPS
jgi:hypothetical protein